jgi:hypothetical protein
MENFYDEKGNYIGFDIPINLDDLCNYDTLKGVNQPINLNNVGLKFLQHSDFNDFPMAQSGYLLKQTLSTLIIYYCHKNKLYSDNIIIPDKFMLDTFYNIFPKMTDKNCNFNINNFKSYFIQLLCIFLIEPTNNIDILINESKLVKHMNNLVKPT